MGMGWLWWVELPIVAVIGRVSHFSYVRSFNEMSFILVGSEHTMRE